MTIHIKIHIKPIIDLFRSYSLELAAGGSLIAGVGLLTLGLLQIHLSTITLNWVKFSCRVLHTMSPLQMTLLGVGALGGGLSLGACLFFIKEALSKRLKERKIEIFSDSVSGKLNYFSSLISLVGVIASAALMTYATQYLFTMHPIANMDACNQLHQIGYLANGSGLEWSIAAYVCGSSLLIVSALNIFKRAFKT